METEVGEREGGEAAHDRLRALPKVELHVHLDGAFDEDILWESVDVHSLPESVPLPWSHEESLQLRKRVEACASQEEYHALITCQGMRSLNYMLMCFMTFLPTVRGRLDLIERMAEAFCARQAASNVVLTEVRYSPHLLAEGGSLGAEESSAVDPWPVLDAVTSGLRKGCRKHGIVVNQLLCAISFRPEWAEEVVDMAASRRAHSPCAVVGIDIAAGEEALNEENAHAYQAHLKAFKRAKDLNLNVTVHAGEEGHAQHVITAIHDFGAQRIGHGYAIVDAPEVLAAVVAAGVHIEACPTSSLETGGWTGPCADEEAWEAHPIRTFFEAGLSVSINTDDPSVFDTDIDEELRIAHEAMGIEVQQVVDSMYSAIDAAFDLTEDERAALRSRIDDHGREPAEAGDEVVAAG